MQREKTQIFGPLIEPTLNRQNKDFAQFEKEQNQLKKQQLFDIKDKRQRLADEAYEIFRQKMPSEVSDYKVIEKIKSEVMNQKPYMSNLNGIQLRNPITQQLIGKNQEYNDDFIPNSLFQGKQKNDEMKQLMIERSQAEVNQMQGKKRNGENFTKYMTHTNDQQQLMQGKKITEYSLKMRTVSDQQIQMQSKQRSDNLNMQQQSVDERQLFQIKRKVPDYIEKYLNQSDNDIQQKSRILPSQMISYDFPLSSPMINRAEKSPEASLFQGKQRSQYNALRQETTDNQNMFQGKRRLQENNFNRYMQKTEDEKPLMQGKGQSEFNKNLKQSEEQIQLFQTKKRNEDSGKYHQQSQVEQNLFLSKKRVNRADKLDLSDNQQTNYENLIKLNK